MSGPIDLPNRSGTVEFGYGLLHRKTGKLVRVRRNHDEVPPFVLTLDPEANLYLVPDIGYVTLLLTGPQVRWVTSEYLPALGHGMSPEDFQAVAIEREIRITPIP